MEILMIYEIVININLSLQAVTFHKNDTFKPSFTETELFTLVRLFLNTIQKSVLSRKTPGVFLKGSRPF